MADDQPTVVSSGKWPPSSDSAPTQLAGDASDRPTPKTLPAQDAGWQPAPPPRPAEPSFRPTSVQSPVAPPAPVAGGQTIIMGVVPEVQVPLAWLAIVEGPGGKRGTLLTLKAETLIGRTAGDLVLGGDRTVSSQHVKIRLEPKEDAPEGEEQQVFVLYDLASANGTYVGNKQTFRDDASRTYRHELRDGDYILIGETALVFKCIE